ncbi:MAG: CRISPR-associated endonuclease Cas2 [Magnetococcales bacterium]|nr:CRISPR-associated endonuclease Cas2 [Magnetococcales bacterium]
MDRPLRYIVCYDVTATRRRTRLAVCLDGFGDRVQKSVFEAVLDAGLFDKMVSEITAVISPTQDSVLIYPLCANCAGKVLRLGVEGPVPGEEQVFVV